MYQTSIDSYTNNCHHAFSLSIFSIGCSIKSVTSSNIPSVPKITFSFFLSYISFLSQEQIPSQPKKTLSFIFKFI
ncbi:hypothetical protein DTX73_08360 [Enterococcus faecium]|uniref:Uncharacterized protein n=1 Tax=Enterococcus faecium TaxID=1352 RepID=A0A7V7GN97_ENTFC|nr:hypothetical protein DTX73_08360 [Enterococcus faecium]